MKNKNKVARSVFAAAILTAMIWSSSAFAALIEYSVDHISGNTWRYNYTINNELTIDIEWFNIYFNTTDYDNLANPLGPANWDAQVVPLDPFFGDGWYDAFATPGPSIAPNDSLGGFSVEFDFLTAGVPGSQFFEILDPASFDVIADGFTMLIDGGGLPLPEPSVFGLMLLVCLLMFWLTQRRPVPVPAI